MFLAFKKIAFLLALAVFFCAPAFADLPSCLSETEFRSLAAEIAPKVNLFAEAWKQDANAEFYGGTTRDYLYWLKGKFRDCRNPEQGKLIEKALRQESVIDVREFIIGDSDVDVVSKAGVSLDAERFGIKKQDSISPDIFDPASERGRNEAVQGYIPAEKIRLQKNGMVKAAQFGDGVSEIYSGKLTVHFTPDEIFAQGHYAQKKLNHPILLALRYLRLAGINYYQSHGEGVPDLKVLLDLDQASAAAVKKIVSQATRGDELLEYLSQPLFKKWLNGALQKAFRSYTNPTAAMELMKAFGVDQLQKNFEGIEPINQYLFAKHRDEKAILKTLASLKTSPDKLYVPPATLFTDGYLYHGTREEGAFRGILLQGTLPSSGGVGGAGLYGVAVKDKEFSEKWGGSKDRLVRLPVRNDAKIVDITRGEGERLWLAHREAGHEKFAELVGADILKYPYNTDAYVVKNSAALGRPEGVYRKVLTLSEAKKLAKAVDSPHSLNDFFQSLGLNRFNETETQILAEALPRNWEKLAPTWRDPEFAAFLKLFNAENTPTETLLRARLGPDFTFVKESLPALEKAETSQAVWDALEGMKNVGPRSLISNEDAATVVARMRAKGLLPDWDPITINGDFFAQRAVNLRSRGPLSLALFGQVAADTVNWLREGKDFKELVKFGAQSEILQVLIHNSLLTKEVMASLRPAWKKTGVLDFFLRPIKDEADLLNRLDILNGMGLLANEIAEEIAPQLKELVKLRFPNHETPFELFQRVGFARENVDSIDDYRALFAIDALNSNGTPKEIREDLFSLLPSHTSHRSYWMNYLRTPWGKKNEPLLSAMTKSESFWTSTFLAPLGRNNYFASLLAENPEFNRQFWEELKENPQYARVIIGDEVTKNLRDLAVLSPDRYREGMNIILSADPKTWIENSDKGEFFGTAKETRGGYQALESIFLPFEPKGIFFENPHAQAWTTAFMETALLGGNIKSDTRKRAVQLLNLPEVQRMPKATEWMNSFLTLSGSNDRDLDIMLSVGLSELHPGYVPGLLELEPWKRHPLAQIWKESLKVPRRSEHGIKFQRAVYFKTRMLGAFGLQKKVLAWQQTLSDAFQPLQNARIGRAVVPAYSADPCRTSFQKLLFGERWRR